MGNLKVKTFHIAFLNRNLANFLCKKDALPKIRAIALQGHSKMSLALEAKSSVLKFHISVYLNLKTYS